MAAIHAGDYDGELEHMLGDRASPGPGQGEVSKLEHQVTAIRRLAFGSMALSAFCLAAMASFVMGGSSAPSGKLHPLTEVHDLSGVQQKWTGKDAVLVPSGFAGCDTPAGSPQIAPIRQSGDFLYFSGIAGWAKTGDGSSLCAKVESNETLQIINAFKWADLLIKAGGTTWLDVLSVKSYHVARNPSINRQGLGSVNEAVFAGERMKRMASPPYPAWSAVGVSELYFTNQIFELSITARRTPCRSLECN
jgi:enamine deaminase RidA (YjgF/YER057c/UK114 family)